MAKDILKEAAGNILAANVAAKRKSADAPNKIEGKVQDLGNAPKNSLKDANMDANVGIKGKDTSKSAKPDKGEASDLKNQAGANAGLPNGQKGKAPLNTEQVNYEEEIENSGDVDGNSGVELSGDVTTESPEELTDADMEALQDFANTYGLEIEKIEEVEGNLEDIFDETDVDDIQEMVSHLVDVNAVETLSENSFKIHGVTSPLFGSVTISESIENVSNKSKAIGKFADQLLSSVEIENPDRYFRFSGKIVSEGQEPEEFSLIVSGQDESEAVFKLSRKIHNEQYKAEFVTNMIESVSIDKDVKGLFEGVEGFTPEFVTKATTLFEAAIKEKTDLMAEAYYNEFKRQINENIERLDNEYEAKIVDTLSYVVEDWVSKNEVAIVSNLRAELAESFMYGLKNLFVEHYVDIPEEKLNVVENLASQVSNLEGKLNEQIERNIELSNVITESVKQEMISKKSEGLTAVQKDKFVALAESISFDDLKEFDVKLQTLIENYVIPTTKEESKQLAETIAAAPKDLIAEEVQTKDDYNKEIEAARKITGSDDPIMNAYVAALRNQLS